ncbi:15-hydroxyprostaglandin dehydrogenase [NAD(+)] [Choanephora cucurbitarum]|uniref:15-hydroxyprostaglandin dehydrogenase [NAD(+)] n=1 Tax=Choanephora cucurbitarum TaxID=101091 RepID=A0A1C7N9N7_9FUNG|nr:15-hydroxyprostaglandin dehydrogenase [NAD(+)] [Choanephora cucurbitarum]
MFSSVKDKVAVITGGASGIGKAAANALIEHGAKVIIGDIQQDKGKKIVDEYNQKAGKKVASFLHTNVTKYDDNIALFQLAERDFGGVDIAFLNAGIADSSDFKFACLEDQEESSLLNVNLMGVIRGTKVALMHMAKRGGGTIVHTASIAGIYPFLMSPLYATSKHAVVGYTRSLALMPQICNVRVNAICPFWVETDLLSPFISEQAESLPHYKYLKTVPKVTLQSVVEAFFTLITDQSRVSQTLLILPTGLQVIDAPVMPENSHPKEAREAYIEALPKWIAMAKVEFEEAQKNYDKRVNALGCA